MRNTKGKLNKKVLGKGIYNIKMLYARVLMLGFVWIIQAIVMTSVSYAQVSVESEIDSIQIFVGEQTKLHVSATVKPGQKVQFRQWSPQQYLVPGVEVVDAPTVDTTDASDGFIKVTQHLLLTSFDDTLYYIPAQKVKVDGKEYQTKNLALKVLTIDVDTLHPNQFFGPKDVQNNPFQWEEWSSIFWMSIIAVVLYLLCWLAYLRLKSNKPIQLKVRIVKKVPPHQKALSAIENIKRDSEKWRVDSGELDSKAYYTQLTDALRKYMEERFGFNAMEMTSAEIIERLKQEEDQQKLSELSMLFETADLVKFAKYTVGVSENDRNLVSAVDFINTTKQENVPTEERIEPTISEQERQTIRMRLSLKWSMALLVVAATAIVTYVLYQLWDIMM